MEGILCGVRDMRCKVVPLRVHALISLRYDRISPPFRAFLETLTATCAQPVFKTACTAGGYGVMSPRGSPLNVGDSFAPIHPVIRTNRQTGWKSIFAGVGLHVSRINGVYDYEDRMIRDYIMRLITTNHDCIARMHWTKGAAAIWNNSCVWHAATVCTFWIRVSVVWLMANSRIHIWLMVLCGLEFGLLP